MAENFINERLVLESRKRLNLTAVDAVNGFTDTCLNLTIAGKTLKILGLNLKITSYNKATGNLTCDGEISEIKYERKKQPLIKRVFK